MKSIVENRRSLILGAALALVLPASAFAADYEIDPAHSSASFSVKHMMVSTVRGQFDKLSGTFAYDEKNPSNSKIEATIDASSIDTNEPKRDEHLKSPDFFDVAKYPTITFKSSKVEKGAKGHLKVTGDLTMHGVTRPVTLDVEGPTAPAKDPWGNQKVGVTATTTVNRKDFGLNWNKALETGGVMVSDEVKITIDAELGQKKAPAVAPASAKKK